MTDPHSLDPDREAIAARAYELWQRRGCPGDSAESDWHEAEAQLRAERLAAMDSSAEPPFPRDPQLSQPVTAADDGVEPPATKRRRRSAATATANPGAPSAERVVARKRPARPDA